MSVQEEFLTLLCEMIDEKSDFNQFCKREKVEFINVLVSFILLIFLSKILKTFRKRGFLQKC
jgi:hypothetical protein